MKPLAGTFLDGPFVGLGYRTPSQEGVTDDAGTFLYLPGETVTFSIGGLVIGSAAAATHLTLGSLHDGDPAGAPDVTRPDTVNRSRFVQSLGRQTDLRDGVLIDKHIREVVDAQAEGISFACDVESFAQADSVRAVFSETGLRFRGAAEARNHLRRALTGIKVLRDVRVPTRDGSYLLADVFRPIEAGNYPVLLRQSVYGRAFRVGSILSDEDLQASEEREAAWHEESRDGIFAYFRHSETAVSANSSTWVPRGYVVVRVDSRGVGRTPGTVDPFSVQESLDYYDAIEWAAQQPWSDGKVGLYGGSYNATIQWNVASLRPPSLKAIAPLASDSDAYRDLAYTGGLFLNDYRTWWFTEMVGGAKNPESDTVDFVGGLAGHPWDDDYYRGAGLQSADFSSIDIPVLTAVSQTAQIHGRAGFEAFAQLKSPDKQLLVWDAEYAHHMYLDSQSDIEAFFDRHLKGVEPDRAPSPVRMVMRTGDGGSEWRDAAEWPVPGTEYRKLFLDAGADGGVGGVTAEPSAHIAVAEYSADVRASEPDLPMAVFETAPFDTDVELAGHFRATVWVASTSSDADLYVSVRVMDGDREVPFGTHEPNPAAPLTWGCLKVSRRALDPELSTEVRPYHTHRREDAQPLSPGDVVKAEVELLPATGRIAAGRRLRIEISPADRKGATSAWARAYDESYHRDAVNRVFTGGPLASSLTLPVISRRAD
ncbi:CocE/NonD family hydrolase [Streptomyces sp. NBC_01341]|uniref:CocE/NonD family hydrolase n=1 Tax=Streptomyces sp. NBC_01341 TaxID=2903831 RepID=UPI002E131730|nr:CocE/NonD family hydrolase [Streptomyces sp. NBC_01341]